jgi:hypothetical protein
LLGVEPGEEAIIYAIEDSRESYSKEHIKARKLKDSLEAMKARWEATEGKVVECRKSIPDTKVRLDVMSGTKCAIAEHKAMQELRALQRKLDAQYAAMVGQDRIPAGDKNSEIRVGQVRRQNTRIEECGREIGLLRSAKASLEGRIAKMELRRRNVEGGWPALVTLMQSATRNTEKDPTGYRLDEPMRPLVAVSQLVPKTIWKTHLVPLGMPSWKTRNSVFDAIPDRMGVRADVFDGSRPNIEKILSIWFTRSSPKRYQAQRISVNAGGRGRGPVPNTFRRR